MSSTPTPEPKVSSSSLPASADGSSSPSSGRAITWAGALVVLSVTAAVCLALPGAVSAYIHGTDEESARAARVLLGCGVTLLGVAAPTSLRDVLAALRRVLPKQ